MFEGHPYKLQSPAKMKNHGHTNYMAWLEKSSTELAGKTLVEIGTTREVLPSQNSTAVLANFCRLHNMRFVTVDMNPKSILRSRQVITKINPSFLAICAKGEDFIRTCKFNIDFLYLDAFDFNHANHSKQRRDDYRRYLKCEITNKLCHEAHLDMVRNLIEYHKPESFCFDDCFYNDGTLTGKGTLAIPYALERGWVMSGEWVFVPCPDSN